MDVTEKKIQDLHEELLKEKRLTLEYKALYNEIEQGIKTKRQQLERMNDILNRIKIAANRPKSCSASLAPLLSTNHLNPHHSVIQKVKELHEKYSATSRKCVDFYQKYVSEAAAHSSTQKRGSFQGLLSKIF